MSKSEMIRARVEPDLKQERVDSGRGQNSTARDLGSYDRPNADVPSQTMVGPSQDRSFAAGGGWQQSGKTLPSRAALRYRPLGRRLRAGGPIPYGVPTPRHRASPWRCKPFVVPGFRMLAVRYCPLPESTPGRRRLTTTSTASRAPGIVRCQAKRR